MEASIGFKDCAELATCTLCPRLCGIDRLAGQRGYCRAGVTPRVFRYGPHFGEEPPITGTNGSGTVFFSHCTLRCVYCQNYPWSQEHRGDDFEVEGLTDIFRRLAESGCHNWNLVSPTPWLPQIRKAVEPLIRSGVSLPFVYNTSGFESTKTLDEFSDLIDIALVDLRYACSESAREGSDAAGYVDAARRTVTWFWEHLGPLRTDSDDVARRGVICRLLALPGRTDEVVDNLAWLARTIGTEIAVSVMAQYTPVFGAAAKPGWDRTVRADEYERVVEAVSDLGFENGWVQELEDEDDRGLLGRDMPAGEGAVGVAND